MQENPYQPPKASSVPPSPESPRIMPLGRAVMFVLGTTAGGAVLGLAFGACLGWLAPSYYRSVFSGGDSPDFQPLAVGIGLGCTQGAGFGALVGLVLVIAYWWFQSRLSVRHS